MKRIKVRKKNCPEKELLRQLEDQRGIAVANREHYAGDGSKDLWNYYNGMNKAFEQAIYFAAIAFKERK